MHRVFRSKISHKQKNDLIVLRFESFFSEKQTVQLKISEGKSNGIEICGKKFPKTLGLPREVVVFNENLENCYSFATKKFPEMQTETFSRMKSALKHPGKVSFPSHPTVRAAKIPSRNSRLLRQKDSPRYRAVVRSSLLQTLKSMVSCLWCQLPSP